jgi:predicted TIM-barrel fold metal-dependent hydrolase
MMLSRRQFLTSTVATGLALSTEHVQPLVAQPAKRLIVDSQIHMWTANTPERPWVPGARPQIPEPMTIERVVSMIDEAGVDRVVIVPPTLEGERYDYGQEAARRYPGRFATMGRIKLDNPNEVRRLASWRQQPALLGVRLNITTAQTEWLTNGTADWFWPAAEKAGVPVMFLTNARNDLFGAIAERHPQLTLIIDHMGVASEALHKGRLQECVEQSAALAKYPNVSVKVSSAPLFSTEGYPWRDVTPHIRKLYDAFGPRRCHWGTDVTNSYAKATYKQRVTHFTEELPFLSEDDKDWIMGRAIVERLRWM